MAVSNTIAVVFIFPRLHVIGYIGYSFIYAKLHYVFDIVKHRKNAWVFFVISPYVFYIQPTVAIRLN